MVSERISIVLDAKENTHDGFSSRKNPRTALKKRLILMACEDGNLEALATLATSERGLVDNRVRHTAWPILLGCQTETQATTKPMTSVPHRDENQVTLDVNRSFVYYPHGQTDRQLSLRRKELQYSIIQVLRKYPFLSYFQGFHDIVQVFLLALGPEMTLSAIERLSLLRIRDFMLPTMDGAIAYLELLPSILQVADSELALHLSQTQPYFALPAILTLYAHEIQEYGDIARLFDFLLAQEAVMSLYLFVIIIRSRKDELFKVERNEPELLHSILSKLPKPLNLEILIQEAINLFLQYPPQRLPSQAWRKISSYSVLKTTRNLVLLSRQTSGDGGRLFLQHAAEVDRGRALLQARAVISKIRLPTKAATVAVFVAGTAWWLNRQGYLGLDLLWPLLRSLRRYF